jgi:hypothetical protein
MKMKQAMQTRRAILSALLIFTISACVTTGNQAEDRTLNRDAGEGEIIFGVGSNVEKEPFPHVQDLGKRVFRPGETIGVMILVKGHVGKKIRLDFIRIDDHFTRTLISETVPTSSSFEGAIFW